MIQVEITPKKMGSCLWLSFFEDLHEHYEGMFTIAVGDGTLTISFIEKEEWDMEDDHPFFQQMLYTGTITEFTPQIVQVRGSRS